MGRKVRGFTLIETVIVISLIGVVSAFGLSQFTSGGTSIANRIAAQDTVYRALQSARDEAIHRTGSPNDTAEADLEAALSDEFGSAAPAVTPNRVTFSYGRDGGLGAGRTAPLTVTIAPQTNPLRLCVFPETGRTAKEPCP